jgi:Xaa-Pro aminopeptidase
MLIPCAGHMLDTLARVPLWQVGLDYRHGTGHGVGSFLFVHEGKLFSLLLQPGFVTR